MRALLSRLLGLGNLEARLAEVEESRDDAVEANTRLGYRLLVAELERDNAIDELERRNEDVVALLVELGEAEAERAVALARIDELLDHLTP